MVTAGVDTSFGDNLSVLENEHASHDLVLSAIRSCKRFLCLEKAKNEDDAYDILSKVEKDQLIHFVSLLLQNINRLIDESQNISRDIFDVFGSVISFVRCDLQISSSTICLCFVSIQKLLEYEFAKNLKHGDAKISLEHILKLIQFLSSVSNDSLKNLGSEVQYSQIMNSILKCLNLSENRVEPNTRTSLKTEILKVFEKLFASERNDNLKVVLKDKLDVWIEKLIPLMFEEDKNLRTAAVAAIKIFWSYFSISERSRGFTCTPKFQNDLQHSYEMKLLTFLQKGTDEPNWATLWCVLLDVLETQLITSQNIQLINSLLTVETKAFKQSNEARDAAFTCWKYLIGKFCVLNEGVLKKRLHLLLQPLEAGNNAKTDQLACHKCDVWWYFICQTQSKNRELTQGIVVPFLNFCFGSPVEISQYNVNALSGRRCRRYDNFRVLSIDALAQILSPVATEEITKIDFKLQRCSTTIIDLSMLINHTRLLINCAAESVVCITHGSCPPTYHVNILVDFIWESLMHQLLVLIRSDDHINARTTEIVKDFFRFIQCIGKQCTTTNLANLLLSPVLENIICGKNALPADVLTSSTYQLTLVDVLVGTPASLLMECLLSPIILSLDGHITKFMNFIDILIEYGIKSNDCLNFSFGVIKRLETLEASVSSCSSGPAALCGTWHSLACKLSPILQKLHQQNCDSFERLTTSILNYPIVNANICIDGQRKLPSNYQELHQVWKIFLQEIINIDSEESCMENKVCDHICLKILEYLKKHKHMSQSLLYISIFVNHIGTVMPYESINSCLNKSDILRSSKPTVDKPFQQLSSFVEILHQLSTMLFACKERDSQLYYCIVVYIAQCLSNLFGHTENSFIALMLISKLSQLIIFLLKLETPSVTVVDFYENIFSMWKQYTSLVSKFWIDMDKSAIEANIFPSVENALEFGSEHMKLFTREALGTFLLSSDLTPNVLKEKLCEIKGGNDVDHTEKESTFSIFDTVESHNSIDVKQAVESNVIEHNTLKSVSDGEISSSLNNKSQDIPVLNVASSEENEFPVSVESSVSSSKLTSPVTKLEENVSESVAILSEDSSLEPCSDNGDGKKLPNSPAMDDDTALDSFKLTVNSVLNEINSNETSSNLQSKTESEMSFGSFNIKESFANSCNQSQDKACIANSFPHEVTSEKSTEQNKAQENIETFQFLKPEKQIPCEAEKASGRIMKTMCLTKHQKEMMRRRREDIPALYSDLSQDTQSSLLSESEDSQVTMPERVSVTSTKSEDIPQSFSILFKRAIRPNSLDTLIKNNLEDDCNKPSAVSSSTCSENESESCMNLDSSSVNVSTITNSEEGLSNSEECERNKVAKIDINCVDIEINPNSCLKETSELKDQSQSVNSEVNAEEENCNISESSSPQSRRKTRRPEKKDVVFLRSKRIQSRILTKQNLDPIQQNLAKKLRLVVKVDDVSRSGETVTDTLSIKSNEGPNHKKSVGNKSSHKQSSTFNNYTGDNNSLKFEFESKCHTNTGEADNSTRHISNKTTKKTSIHKVVFKRNLVERDRKSDKIILNESSEKSSDVNTISENKQLPNTLIVSIKPMSALDENNTGSTISNVNCDLENNCKNDKVTRIQRRLSRKLLETKSRSRRSKSVKKFEGHDSLKDKIISDYFLNKKEPSTTSKEIITNQISDGVASQCISNRRRKLNDTEPYTNVKKRKIDHDNPELASKPSGISTTDENIYVSNDSPIFSGLKEHSSTEICTNKECTKEKVCNIPNDHEIENCSPGPVSESSENLPCMKGSGKDDKSCSGCSVLLKSVRDTTNSQFPRSALQECDSKPDNVIPKLGETSESECGQHLNETNPSFPISVNNHTDSEVIEKVCSQSVQNISLPIDESLYPSDSQDVIENSQDSSFCPMPQYVSKLSAIKSNTENSLSVSKQELESKSCLSSASPKNPKSVTHGEQTDADHNLDKKVTCPESVLDSESSLFGEAKPNIVLVLTEEPQVNQNLNVADPSTNKRRKKEPMERLMQNLAINFKSSFVPSGSRQPNTLEKKRNSLSMTKNETTSSAKRRHSVSSDNRRNKRRGERDVKQSQEVTQPLPETLKDRPFSSDSTISSIARTVCQVANKDNSQSNLTYVDKGTCTDSEDLRIRIIFDVGEDKVSHKMDNTNDKSDGDKQRILPSIENISIPYNVTESKFDNNLISDNLQAVKDSNECSEEMRIIDSCHTSHDKIKSLDKNIDNSKGPVADVNKSCASMDKVQVLVHSKMDNVGLNPLHNDSTEPLRALDLISINSFNTNVGKSSNNSELKENSLPSSDCDMKVAHGCDQFTSRPKLSLHMRKKRHNILSPAGDTKNKFKNQSSPAKRCAESKILSSGMTGRAAHLLGLAVSEFASEEKNQPSTSQLKEIHQFKEFQMDKKEDSNADKIYITSSDGHVSTSLWVKHEYKFEASPATTILKQPKEPIQQHHEVASGVSCMDVSPGRMRKRVSFFDPVVSHKLLFRTDAPSIVHIFDQPIPEESDDFGGTSNESVQEFTPSDEVQVNVTPVASSQNDAILDSQLPIWPTLTECENPIDDIISDITTPCWTESTIAAFRERGITTVGDLCKLNEISFMKLQISSPNLEAVKVAIKCYEEKLLNLMDTSEPFMDENPQHESVTIEEISDETSDCMNEIEDECCVELCEETIQVDEDSKHDSSSIIKTSDNFEDSLSLKEHIKLLARNYSARQIYSALESEGIFKTNLCKDETPVSNCVCNPEIINAFKTLGELMKKQNLI